MTAIRITRSTVMVFVPKVVMKLAVLPRVTCIVLLSVRLLVVQHGQAKRQACTP